MSTWYDRFVRLNNVDGSTNADRFKSKMKDEFDEYITNSPNVYSVTLSAGFTTIALQDIKYGDKKTDGKYMFMAYDDTATVGEIFIWDSKYWIVLNEENRTIKSHRAYVIEKCNYNIKWYDQYGDLQTKYCVIKSQSSQTGDLFYSQYFAIGDSELAVILPNDSDTNIFSRDFRFIISGTPYKISSIINDFETEGLFYLIVTEDQVKENDDLENNIAQSNYAYDINDSPVTSGYDIIINGEVNVKLYDTNTFSCVVYNNGTEVSENVTWTLSDPDASIISQDETSCIIKGDAIGTCTLKCELDSDSLIYDEKDINIVSIF